MQKMELTKDIINTNCCIFCNINGPYEIINCNEHDNLSLCDKCNEYICDKHTDHECIKWTIVEPPCVNNMEEFINSIM